MSTPARLGNFSKKCNEVSGVYSKLMKWGLDIILPLFVTCRHLKFRKNKLNKSSFQAYIN